MELARMERALRIIGYSAHTGGKRLGPKAQCARWGLGEDAYPGEWESKDPLKNQADNVNLKKSTSSTP